MSAHGVPASTSSHVAGATRVKDPSGASPSNGLLNGDLNGDLNGLLNGDLNGDLNGLLNGDLNGDLNGLLKGAPSAGEVARSEPAKALACAVRTLTGMAESGTTGCP